MKRILVALLLLLPAFSLNAKGLHKCAGQRVWGVNIVGMVTPRLQEEDFQEKLVSLVDIHPPADLSAYRLQRARRRLMETGLFQSVAFDCPDGRMVIRVRENHRIKQIKLSGNHRLYAYQVLPKLFIGKGDVLNPDTPDGKVTLQGVRDQVRSIYSDEGYFGTQVQVTWKHMKYAWISILIKVREGVRYRIARVKFQAPDFSGMQGQGPHCARITRANVLKYANIRVRQVFSRNYIKSRKNKIVHYLQMFGVVRPRVDMSFDKDSRSLSIRIQYSRCWALGVMVHWEGNDWGPAKRIALYQTLPFGGSGIYNEEEAQVGIRNIKDFLEERGYLLSRVSLFYKKMNSGKGPLQGVIEYSVEPGTRLEIRRIKFKGNRAFDSRILKKQMKTKVYDFFGSPGIVIIENVFSDLDRIKQYYRDHGFYAFHYKYAQGSGKLGILKFREGDSTVYQFRYQDKAFRLRTWPDDDGVYLEIGVEEGPRRRVNRLSITGNRTLKHVRTLLGMHEGGPFSLALLKRGIRQIRRALARTGHIRARVTCECTTDTGQQVSCENPPDDAKLVNLTVDIQEGAVTRVGSIMIYGNRKTRKKVILRDMPRPGQPFNRSALSRAVGNLKDLGIFTALDTTTIGPDENPPARTATIVVHAREATTRFIDISVGFESMNRNESFPKAVSKNLGTEVSASDHFWGFTGRSLGLSIPDVLITGQVRYSDLNLAGTSYRLYIPVKYGFSMTAWDRYGVVAPSFVDPYFFLPDMTLRITPFGLYDRATGNLDVIRFGNEISITKALGHRFYSSLTYEISTVKTRVPDSGKPYSPWTLENKVIPTLSYDGLDHPINPHKGFYVSTVLSYINALVSSDFQNFLKFETTLKFFWSIRNLLTFGVMVHYGDSKPFDARDLPQDERFTLGGNKGVRGYSDDGIAQYNPDGSLRLLKNPDGTYSKPFGGDTVLNGSIELRFPIVRSIGLYGCGFTDWGGLGESLRDFNKRTIRVSVGVGLRYILAGQLPIRLDYGFIMDRRCKYADPHTGQCIEREGIGSFQFGLLYSF